MRTATEQLGKVLRGGSFSAILTVDVFYGATRVLQDVPVDDWSFSADLDAEIPTGGKITVTYQGDFAESYTPREVTDALAPFGQRVVAYLTVNAGPFTERIQVGVFRIADVPAARDDIVTRKGRRLVVGSVVELTLLDLFHQVKRATFRTLEQPLSLASTWAEIARITRLPVTRTVLDVDIPAVITYDRNRVTATQVLAGYLRGRALPLSDGTVGVIPDAYGAVVADLKIGDEGVLLEVEYQLSSDDIPNVVYGDFEDAAGNGIHVESEETRGSLSVNGPYGENVIEFPDERKAGINTIGAAQNAVDAYRTALATRAKPLVSISTLIDPRLELGDVVRAYRPDRILTGRILKQAISGDGTGGPKAMDLTLEVSKDEPVK